MAMLERLQKKETSLAVVGLGYVGLPLAAAYSHHFKVIGFDVNQTKITEYLAGKDPTDELGDMSKALD